MHDLTIAQAANSIRVGTFSAVELMEALLARSNALDPKLRVWETLNEDAALDAARSAQAEIESAGPKGPLHGVPIGIKDIFNTEGVRTASGSPIYDDYVPDFDSTAVARLRAAGAVVMGKAVTTEFASFDPSPTRNPWNAEHTPGGSSSGSAAGVAARLFPAALGSQTSGSVLRPASYNGVVGLKPTFGRISRYGVTPVAWSLDTVGYFTRTVEDAAIMLDALAGRDDLDPSSSREPVSRYAEAAANTASAPRIGVVRSFFFDYADDETVAHTEQVLGRLAGAGAVLEDASPSTDFDVLLAAHRTAMNVESAVTRGNDYRGKARRLLAQRAQLRRVGHAGPGDRLHTGAAAQGRLQARGRGAGLRVRRAPYAVDTNAGPTRPDHHRRRLLPGALDDRRTPRHHDSVGPLGVRPAVRHPARGRPVRRGAPAVGCIMVRGYSGRLAHAACIGAATPAYSTGGSAHPR